MNSTPLSFLHTRPPPGLPYSWKPPTSSSATVCVCVFCNSLCCASLLGLSALNVTAHVCTSRQPIVGALVIHIRTHLLLRPSKGFTSGDEISWGHIKASHTPGCTVKEHQRDGVMLFPLPLLVLSAWIRGSPDHIFFFFFWTQEVSRHTLTNAHEDARTVQTLNVALPGTSIIFLYTFKKAASASLLLLLNASICKERRKKKKWLIVSYTTSHLSVTSMHSKGRPINFTVRLVYISVYPHYASVCCMRSRLSWQWLRWCFLPVESVQLFSRWRMRFVCRVPVRVRVGLSSRECA